MQRSTFQLAALRHKLLDQGFGQGLASSCILVDVTDVTPIKPALGSGVPTLHWAPFQVWFFHVFSHHDWIDSHNTSAKMMYDVLCT